MFHFLVKKIEDLREECYGFALTVFEKNVSVAWGFFQFTVSDQVVNLTSKYTFENLFENYMRFC